jgi:hypothetical protein
MKYFFIYVMAFTHFVWKFELILVMDPLSFSTIQFKTLWSFQVVVKVILQKWLNKNLSLKASLLKLFETYDERKCQAFVLSTFFFFKSWINKEFCI